MPDATQICLKHGFDAKRLYQVVFTAADPYVLGIGFAAWRDVAAFFKSARADDHGTPNPIAGLVTHSITRGISQSGNYLRGWLHLGFNQSENGARVHDGMWPIIAGRRIALNFRWAQPDGVLELYQAGSEGPQWWLPHPDAVRGGPGRRHPRPLHTVEHVPEGDRTLRLGRGVGAQAHARVGRHRRPGRPAAARRACGATTSPAPRTAAAPAASTPACPTSGLPKSGPACPGNNFGTGVAAGQSGAARADGERAARALSRLGHEGHAAAAEPIPHGWPTARWRAPTRRRSAFPTLPGLRASVPEGDFIMPVHDYDWGPRFNAQDGSGIASIAPPRIKRVLTMFAPKVDADGNERGGVPVVLLDAPLGTYLGWNITADGDKPFHKGQICNYVGGMVPFARTAAERRANGDPRPSLEERYGSHAGYVERVRAAAARAVEQKFLLPEDAQSLIDAAQASAVLR